MKRPSVYPDLPEVRPIAEGSGCVETRRPRPISANEEPPPRATQYLGHRLFGNAKILPLPPAGALFADASPLDTVRSVQSGGITNEQFIFFRTVVDARPGKRRTVVVGAIVPIREPVHAFCSVSRRPIEEVRLESAVRTRLTFPEHGACVSTKFPGGCERDVLSSRDPTALSAGVLPGVARQTEEERLPPRVQGDRRISGLRRDFEGLMEVRDPPHPVLAAEEFLALAHLRATCLRGNRQQDLPKAASGTNPQLRRRYAVLLLATVRSRATLAAARPEPPWFSAVSRPFSGRSRRWSEGGGRIGYGQGPGYAGRGSVPDLFKWRRRGTALRWRWPGCGRGVRFRRDFAFCV